MRLVDILVALKENPEELDPEYAYESLIAIRDRLDDFIRKLLESGVVREVVLSELADRAEEPWELNHRVEENGIEVIPDNRENIDYLMTAISSVITKEVPGRWVKLKFVNGTELTI